MPRLLALSGPSRSGKGTVASVVHELAAERGLTVCERQLSGPGKQYLASAWRPDISEHDAILWFEELKVNDFGPVEIGIGVLGPSDDIYGSCTLQEYMQRMIQGARDRWGDDFWTEKMLPLSVEAWKLSFATHKAQDKAAWKIADIALISDLRQFNEATRVRELGGTVIELYRPKNDDPYRTGKSHITEQRLDPSVVDFTLINDADVDQLKVLARRYLEPLLETTT